MVGETQADRQRRQEALMKAKAAAQHDAAVEGQIIRDYCKGPQWEVVVTSLYRRRQAAESIMMTSMDFNEVNKARAQYQELTWLMELPFNV